MSFILFNHEHSNTRGFYTATYNTMNQHIFFCNETDCSNKVPMYLGKCVDCAEPPVTHCEDCGAWSQVFPDNCCHTCHMKRVRREPTHVCNGEWDYDLGYRVCDNSDDKDCPQHEPRCTCNGSEEPCDHCAQYLADKAEYEIWCGVPEPQCECQVCRELSAPGNSETAGWICDECFKHAFNHHRNCHETRETCCCYRVQCRVNELKPQDEAPQCTCDGSGRMCDLCAEEYMEPCRGCGVNSHLWTDDMYCRSCYVERYGDEFPAAAAPPGCVDCGKEYSVGLALDPTRCPGCVLSAQFPCTGRRNSVTSPVAELFTRPCAVEGCTTRALYYSMPPDVDEGPLILRCEEHYEPLPVSPRSSCNECDRSENGEYAEDCTDPTPARSLEDLRGAIAHIKEKLKTRMTFGQNEHWERLLKFREKELAENEAEMWAGYDQDDLNKLDLQNRRGF